MKKYTIVLLSICIFSCNNQSQKSSADMPITDSNSKAITSKPDSGNTVRSTSSVTIGEGSKMDGAVILQDGPSTITLNGKTYTSKTGNIKFEKNKLIIDGKIVDTIK